jgi:hypothetical protein
MAENHSILPPTSQQLELATTSVSNPSDTDIKRQHLLSAVSSCKLNTIEERVAWLLNHYPNTRDSDVTLQIRYWQTFEPKRYDGWPISIRDYYRLAKLTSLARARATIQNELKLFQASSEVKKRRKQLQGDEHVNALSKRANFHKFIIYVDESGKTQDNLVVGSVWFLNGNETFEIYKTIDALKTTHGFKEELHFKSISEAKLQLYFEIADLIASKSGTISFKVISIPRRGIADLHEGLLKLTYHLITRGVEHENTSGRAPLPRGIQVCKDAEAEGQDKLFIAELADRLRQSATTQFNNELYIEEFSTDQSSKNILLQLTDLFVSSVGRQLNTTGERSQPKDRFADYFLNKLGIIVGRQQSESLGDMTIHITL